MNRQLCERREFLLMGLGLSAVAPSLLFADEALGAASPTPACGSHGGATASQSAGPYYRLDSPFKDDFTSDVSSGDQITVRGYVLDSGCRPIFGALLDFWQADQSGSYDNVGYRSLCFEDNRPGSLSWTDSTYPRSSAAAEREATHDAALLSQPVAECFRCPLSSRTSLENRRRRKRWPF